MKTKIKISGLVRTVKIKIRIGKYLQPFILRYDPDEWELLHKDYPTSYIKGYFDQKGEPFIQASHWGGSFTKSIGMVAIDNIKKDTFFIQGMKKYISLRKW